MKCTDFWENFSTQIHDDDFRHFYCMDRSTLRALTAFLNLQQRSYKDGRLQVSPHKMVGITLCYLGSHFTYRQLSGIFGLSDECVSLSWSIMDLLNAKCKDIIKWLKKEDYEAIAKEFNRKQKRQFPNVIGAIHGCHMRISRAKSEQQVYYNFKNFHSIQLQAVCLYNHKFVV